MTGNAHTHIEREREKERDKIERELDSDREREIIYRKREPDIKMNARTDHFFQ